MILIVNNYGCSAAVNLPILYVRISDGVDGI
jgi:hypothetical protein